MVETFRCLDNSLLVFIFMKRHLVLFTGKGQKGEKFVRTYLMTYYFCDTLVTDMGFELCKRTLRFIKILRVVLIWFTKGQIQGLVSYLFC